MTDKMLCVLADEIAAFPVTFNHMGIFDGIKVLFIAPNVNCPCSADLLCKTKKERDRSL